ncbi:MAG: HNH endonuclease, partial [Gammaproteobacteria bacterium]|nr:HNH endonuclease [Gammaproteobacteria bacterium]
MSRSRFCEKHKHVGSVERKRRNAAFDRRRGSAAKRGYGRRWQRLRAAVLSTDPICCMCHSEVATVVDHIIPKRMGGNDARA